MKSVLILEDLSETRRWLSAVVARAFPGARVSEAGTVAAAKALIDREVFDLALVDLNLPDGGNIELNGFGDASEARDIVSGALNDYRSAQ